MHFKYSYFHSFVFHRELKSKGQYENQWAKIAHLCH